MNARYQYHVHEVDGSCEQLVFEVDAANLGEADRKLQQETGIVMPHKHYCTSIHYVREED